MPLLTILRAQLVVPVALFAVCLLLARFLTGRIIRALVIVLACAFALVAAFGALLGLHGHMLSSSLATTAVAYAHAQPLYHSADSAERYALLYGPLSFLAYLPPSLVSADIRAFQVWTVLPAAVTVGALWWISRRLASRMTEAIVILQGSVMLITFAKFEWAPRADIWIVCFCALGLLAAELGQPLWSVLGMAISGAAVLDLKFSTALIAALPPLLYWTRTRKALPSLAAWVLIFPLSASIFLLPRISLTNYVHGMEASAKHGLVGSLVLLNLLAAFSIFLVPIILAGWFYVSQKGKATNIFRRHALFAGGVLLVTLGCVLTGAKRGAGPWHCAPLIPIACLCSARLLRELEVSFSAHQRSTQMAGIAAALAIALALLGARTLRVTFASYRLGQPPLSSEVADDLRQIISSLPHKDIEMGYGSGSKYELSWERSLLVASGSHYTLDVDSLADMELSGERLPNATLSYIDRCVADVWLIPKEEQPFTIENAYHLTDAQVPEEAFPPVFRMSFQQHYRIAGHSRFYDLYECRR